jgi:hypothetical protein
MTTGEQHFVGGSLDVGFEDEGQVESDWIHVGDRGRDVAEFRLWAQVCGSRIILDLC